MRMNKLVGVLLVAVLGAAVCARAAEPTPTADAPDWQVVSETMTGDKAPSAKPKPLVGVGLVLSTKPGERGVIGRVVKDSPADEMGLEPGMRVIGLNGQSVADLSSAQIAAKMQGKAGGKVKLLVFMPKLESEITYELERVELPQPLVWTTGPDDKVYHRDLDKPDETPFENTPEAVINRLRKP